MPRFEIYTRKTSSDVWKTEPHEPYWRTDEGMAIARAQVLVQLAKEEGETILAYVLLAVRIGKPKIIWRSDRDQNS